MVEKQAKTRIGEDSSVCPKISTKTPFKNSISGELFFRAKFESCNSAKWIVSLANLLQNNSNSLALSYSKPPRQILQKKDKYVHWNDCIICNHSMQTIVNIVGPNSIYFHIDNVRTVCTGKCLFIH